MCKKQETMILLCLGIEENTKKNIAWKLEYTEAKAE